MKIRTKKTENAKVVTVTKTFQNIVDKTVASDFVGAYLDLCDYESAEAYIIPTPEPVTIE